ncbi:hypothetical protein J2Z83_003736 [Virgibacillus natechei]|uniref:Uncharacterized protein n=2 Tax=Virgibacillus natechei TaxID=1216297 RepID=A0ABS4ILZ3_9BACI|nr:hypothetical protein [Virgibacillus natechei]
MKNVPANTGRILGEDGEVYNLVDLLQNVGGGNMDPNDFYNKEEVDGLLTDKADSSYVDTELGKKANASSLSNKADQSIVDDLIARIEALEGD